uniref:2'-5' oligoadenylate synthase n=1 Tax=Pelusios castaneus TaxID=367368 RepID=A0A8C8VFD1_9SAUR
MAQDLYQTPARKLDKFVFDVLQPDSTFLRQAGQAIDTICEFLKTNCFADRPPPRIKVDRIVKGGSLGKGTSLKGGSDADLVVFLDCFKGYNDQETNRAGIIQEIRRMLEKCQQQWHFEVIIETSRWPNPRVLSFQMRSKTTVNESIDFDMLPAYNALRKGKPHSQVYVELINCYSRGGEFSTCFTELQRDFVVERCTKLKSLIRLVKYWYKQVRQRGQSLPPKYALELLSVYAWERGSRDRAFKMAEGFRTVLELIRQYKKLCIYWTINYDFEDELVAGFLNKQLRKPRSVSLHVLPPWLSPPMGDLNLKRCGEGFVCFLICFPPPSSPVCDNDSAPSELFPQKPPPPRNIDLYPAQRASSSSPKQNLPGDSHCPPKSRSCLSLGLA